MTLHHLLGGHFLQPAGPPGMMPVDLVLELVAGEDYLLSIDDDYVIANIDEWSICCFIFSHQQPGSDGRKPADGLAVCVDDKPIAVLLQILPARYECLHDTNLQIPLKEKERTAYEMVAGVVKTIKNGTLANA